MKFITYYQHEIGLQEGSEQLFGEYILAIEGLSRNPLIAYKDAREVIQKLRTKSLKIVIEWDLLMTDSQLEAASMAIASLNLLPNDVLRVYDLGAFEYARKNDILVQPLLETGNNNIQGMLGWINYFGTSKIDRVVLSFELSKMMLSQIIKDLPCACELLIAGNIPVFSSPRPITNNHSTPVTLSDVLYARSEESGHKGFRLVRTSVGTNMMHSKDLFLLDKLAEFKELGIEFVRLDLRFKEADSIASYLDILRQIKTGSTTIGSDSLPFPVIRGFWGANKTDVLFDKLKNKLFQIEDEGFVGEVIDHKKKEYMVVAVKNLSVRISVGDQIRIVTPEFKEKFGKIKFIKNSELLSLESVEKEDYIILNHISGACARTRVFLTQIP